MRSSSRSRRFSGACPLPRGQEAVDARPARLRDLGRAARAGRRCCSGRRAGSPAWRVATNCGRTTGRSTRRRGRAAPSRAAGAAPPNVTGAQASQERDHHGRTADPAPPDMATPRPRLARRRERRVSVPPSKHAGGQHQRAAQPDQHRVEQRDRPAGGRCRCARPGCSSLPPSTAASIFSVYSPRTMPDSTAGAPAGTDCASVDPSGRVMTVRVPIVDPNSASRTVSVTLNTDRWIVQSRRLQRGEPLPAGEHGVGAVDAHLGQRVGRPSGCPSPNRCARRPGSAATPVPRSRHRSAWSPARSGRQVDLADARGRYSPPVRVDEAQRHPAPHVDRGDQSALSRHDRGDLADPQRRHLLGAGLGRRQRQIVLHVVQVGHRGDADAVAAGRQRRPGEVELDACGARHRGHPDRARDRRQPQPPASGGRTGRSGARRSSPRCPDRPWCRRPPRSPAGPATRRARSGSRARADAAAAAGVDRP